MVDDDAGMRHLICMRLGAAGFETLADHGRQRVGAGITTAAEVARVLGEEAE